LLETAAAEHCGVVYEDREQNVWIGTSAGARFDIYLPVVGRFAAAVG